MNAVTQVELLPCPFCGSTDLRLLKGGPTLHDAVKCVPCNLYIPLTADEWNRRAPAPPSQEVVPDTISEAQADCLGMPVSFYERCIRLGKALAEQGVAHEAPASTCAREDVVTPEAVARDQIGASHTDDCALRRGGCCTCGAPMTLEEKAKSNTWDHLSDFVKVWNAHKAGEWEWYLNSECKYVELRIDMRTGHCIIRDRHGQRIDPKDLEHQYGRSPAQQSTADPVEAQSTEDVRPDASKGEL